MIFVDEGNTFKIDFEVDERFKLGEERCWNTLVGGSQQVQWRQENKTQGRGENGTKHGRDVKGHISLFALLLACSQTSEEECFVSVSASIIDSDSELVVVVQDDVVPRRSLASCDLIVSVLFSGFL